MAIDGLDAIVKQSWEVVKTRDLDRAVNVPSGDVSTEAKGIIKNSECGGYDGFNLQTPDALNNAIYT